MTSRRYSEGEVREIFERAIEEGGSVPGQARDGLTLQQIQEIGAEVGVSQASLERAARSLANPSDQRSLQLFGASTSPRVERRVEGGLGGVAASEVLAAIRRVMSQPGELTEVGGMLEWQASGEFGHRVITLASEGGGTTVTGMSNLSTAVVVTHLPTSLIGFIVSLIGFTQAADAGSEIGMAFFAALLPALLLVMRRIFTWLSRSEARKLEGVVHELATLIEKSAEAGPEGLDGA